MTPLLSFRDEFVHFAVYATATGQVLRYGYVASEEDAAAQAGEGESVLLGEVPPGHYIEGGVAIPMGEAPSPDHVYDWTVHAWVTKPLETLRAQRWSDIKLQRDLLEASGFPYLGKSLDSDSRSVQRINTAVQAAQAALAVGQPFAIVWTCADNTLLELDGAQMLGAPVALALYADHLHQTAKALHAQIDAATTAEAIAAVAWPVTTL